MVENRAIISQLQGMPDRRRDNAVTQSKAGASGESCQDQKRGRQVSRLSSRRPILPCPYGVKAVTFGKVQQSNIFLEQSGERPGGTPKVQSQSELDSHPSRITGRETPRPPVRPAVRPLLPSLASFLDARPNCPDTVGGNEHQSR